MNPSPSGTRRRTQSILVVDDDPDIQVVLQFALEDAGYRPLPAPTGEAGLLIAHEAAPDAALVDLRLPGLHGLDLIPSLRATSPMPDPDHHRPDRRTRHHHRPDASAPMTT